MTGSVWLLPSCTAQNVASVMQETMLGLTMELAGACTHCVSPIQPGASCCLCPCARLPASLAACNQEQPFSPGCLWEMSKLGCFCGRSRLWGCGSRAPAPWQPRHLSTGSEHRGHPETGSTGLERCLVTRTFGKATEVPKV